MPSREFAKDLTNGSQIILQLAYWFYNKLHAYGLFFDNGKAKWEKIKVSSTYWAAGVNYENTIKPQRTHRTGYDDDRLKILQGTRYKYAGR